MNYLIQTLNVISSLDCCKYIVTDERLVRWPSISSITNLPAWPYLVPACLLDTCLDLPEVLYCLKLGPVHLFLSSNFAVIEQLILEKEPAGHSTSPHNEFAVAVIKDTQIVGHTPSEIYRLRGILLHQRALLSAACCLILLKEGGKEKA